MIRDAGVELHRLVSSAEFVVPKSMPMARILPDFIDITLIITLF